MADVRSFGRVKVILGKKNGKYPSRRQGGVGWRTLLALMSSRQRSAFSDQLGNKGLSRLLKKPFLCFDRLSTNRK